MAPRRGLDERGRAELYKLIELLAFDLHACQRDALDALADGLDLVASIGTGWGKTLIYIHSSRCATTSSARSTFGAHGWAYRTSRTARARHQGDRGRGQAKGPGPLAGTARGSFDAEALRVRGLCQATC